MKIEEGRKGRCKEKSIEKVIKNKREEGKRKEETEEGEEKTI